MDVTYSYNDLLVGMKAKITKVFYQDEVLSYGKASGDTNPIHYDHSYASKTIFQYPIVQGLLVSSLFGGLLGTILPGPGTIHLGQSVKFIKPVFVGETIFAEIELISKREDKKIITFKSRVFKENGEVAIEGEDVVMFSGIFKNN